MKEASNRSRFVPEGWHTITPRIVVRDAERLVEFLRPVFGVTGDYRPDLPSIKKIGDL
jgi:PhnB protein